MPSFAIKPAVPALRRDHPLVAAGAPLVAAFPSGFGVAQAFPAQSMVRDLAGNAWTTGSTANLMPLVVSPWGPAWKFFGPTTHLANASVVLPTTACTVLLVLTMPTALQDGSAFGAAGNSDLPGRFQAHMPYQGQILWDFGWGSGEGRLAWTAPSPSTFFTATNWHLVALRAGSMGSSIWVDGARRASASTPLSRTNSGIPPGMLIGAYASWNGDNGIDSLHVFARELSDAEILAWMDDPYAHVRPRRPRVLVPGSGDPAAAAVVYHAGGALATTAGTFDYAF